TPAAAGTDSPASPVQEALEALIALGYARSDGAQALEKARREAGDGARTETLVRLALKQLYRG
ncbi:MAG TPA: hypothetical protein VD902_22445, partial [Symbiobacteriaceae bacterium]|nr:hypothetical protein [Symbiobacteriaceae bacterium]